LSFEQAVFESTAGTKILAISSREQGNYERYYGTSSERFHLLPPGVSRGYVPPENVAEQRKEMRKRLGAEPNQKVILFVGSDFKRKGLDRALQAMAKLPSDTRNAVCLHILGPDNDRPFQRMAKKLNIRGQVRFWGGQDNAPLFFWGADLLIHPAYEENTGTVLLDALVSGLPVLTTDVCGYAHHIDAAQAGFVVPSPVSTKVLAVRLEEMMSTEKRELFAKNARKYASAHDLHSLPQEAADLIERFAFHKAKGEREA
jgi:UDP-glucose:(heptosyl)LPS alpha-1,3-glucosyltransferase